MDRSADFHDDLIGKTIESVDVTDDTITFKITDGSIYMMYHAQDCCESVYVEDIVGSWDDIIGFPLVIAEESTNSENPPADRYVESFTWTFYRLVTGRGAVTIRWFGSSNGYYSESVDFRRFSD